MKLRQKEPSPLFHRGFGSADIAAAVRSILLVERDKNKNRWIRAVKSNFDEADFSRVYLDFDSGHRLTFREAGPHRSPEVQTPERKLDKASRLLSILLAEGPRPVAEINRLLASEDISVKTAQRARSLLGAKTLTLGRVTCWKLP